MCTILFDSHCFKKYCKITPLCGSAAFFCHELGIGLSMSPAIWQQFTDKVFGNILHRERYTIHMEDTTAFSRINHYSENLVNLFKAGINFES